MITSTRVLIIRFASSGDPTLSSYGTTELLLMYVVSFSLPSPISFSFSPP